MAAFYQSFGFLVYDISHFHVVFSWLVKGGCDHLSLHRACHVGNLLRTLIDEQNDHIYLWVVGSNGIGYLLEQHGLTCFRLCDNQSALSLANRREEVDDADR